MFLSAFSPAFAQAAAQARAEQLIQDVQSSCPCGCQCTADAGNLQVFNQRFVGPGAQDGRMEPLSLCSWISQALDAAGLLPPIVWGVGMNGYMATGPDDVEIDPPKSYYTDDLFNVISLSAIDYSADLGISQEYADAKLAGGWLHEIKHALDTFVLTNPTTASDYIDYMTSEYNATSIEIAFIDMLGRYNDCMGGTALSPADLFQLAQRRQNLVAYANGAADNINKADDDSGDVNFVEVPHVQ